MVQFPADDYERFRPLRIFNRLRGEPRKGRLAVPSIGVASGKGGTGKTFTSVNLALRLAQGLGSVQILDADLGLGNSHLQLGLRPEGHIQHFLQGEKRLDELIIQSDFGVSLLPGGSGISRLSHLEPGEIRRLGRGISNLKITADALVVDSAAGISRQTLLFLRCCDFVVLVLQPELSSLTDAYALLKCLILREHMVQVHVLVNRVYEEGEGLETFEKLQDVASRFLHYPLHYLGAIPEDPTVRRALARKTPILLHAPESPAARAMAEVGDRLLECLAALPEAEGRADFRSRMLERS